MNDNTYKYKGVCLKTLKTLYVFRTIDEIENKIQFLKDTGLLKARKGYYLELNDDTHINMFYLDGKLLEYKL